MNLLTLLCHGVILGIVGYNSQSMYYQSIASNLLAILSDIDKDYMSQSQFHFQLLLLSQTKQISIDVFRGSLIGDFDFLLTLLHLAIRLRLRGREDDLSVLTRLHPHLFFAGSIQFLLEFVGNEEKTHGSEDAQHTDQHEEKRRGSVAVGFDQRPIDEREGSQCDALDHLHQSEGSTSDLLLHNQWNGRQHAISIETIPQTDKHQTSNSPHFLLARALRVQEDDELGNSEDEHAQHDEVSLVADLVDQNTQRGREDCSYHVGDHEGTAGLHWSEAETFHEEFVGTVQERHVETNCEHAQSDCQPESYRQFLEVLQFNLLFLLSNLCSRLHHHDLVLLIILHYPSGTLSAFLSMQAAASAQTKLIRHTKTDTKRGVPRFPADSQMSGVRQLLSAFPNSGKVTAIPSANANSLPLNQNETILACAVIRLSLASPNSMRPMRMVVQLSAYPPMAMESWKTVTPAVRVISPILTPRQSMRKPMKKVAKILGKAKMVQSS